MYETLMDSTSRVNYNLGGASAGAQNVNADDVLDAVLRKIYQDFFDGDFEYILAMVDVLNDTAMHDPRMCGTAVYVRSVTSQHISHSKLS